MSKPTDHEMKTADCAAMPAREPYHVTPEIHQRAVESVISGLLEHATQSGKFSEGLHHRFATLGLPVPTSAMVVGEVAAQMGVALAKKLASGEIEIGFPPASTEA